MTVMIMTMMIIVTMMIVPVIMMLLMNIVVASLGTHLICARAPDHPQRNADDDGGRDQLKETALGVNGRIRCATCLSDSTGLFVTQR